MVLAVHCSRVTKENALTMEGTGEISDTDSGIILHSSGKAATRSCGQSHDHHKDVTTHTRAMKLKHQALQDRLQRCVLELKKLCIREAELTGELSADYPLSPGETPPKESELSLVHAELALQMKIYEAARKLCREEHLNKAVKRSRVQQCKREEKRLKELQEAAFRLKLQHGRSSPLPAFMVPLPEQHHLPQTFPVSSPSSANSSILSSSVASQPHTPIKHTPSHPTPGQLTPGQLTPIKRTLSHHTPIKRTPSLLTPSQLTPSPFTPSQLTPSLLTPRTPGSPSVNSVLSFNSNPEYDAPPIQHSPWTESSLDQPFQKSKKSRSSSKKSTASSPASARSYHPWKACLGNTGSCHSSFPAQVDFPTPNSSGGREERGRTRGVRRRLTDYTVMIPETPMVNPAGNYVNQANSEDSNSEHSSTSRTSSVCHEQHRHYQHLSPTGRVGPPPAFQQGPGFYQNSRYQSGASFNRGYYGADVAYALDLDRGYPPHRRDYVYAEVAHPGPPMMGPPRWAPQEVRLSRSPSLWEPQHYRSNGLPRQVVNDQLKSWHQRNQLRGPRPRSLDRQGAVRVKNVPDWVSPLAQNQRYQEQNLWLKTTI
ncbi:hypothetical protein CRUP_007105 [Coryphaenoides rupestris]|nr:hypothetical protein CRUP_007105 [Coryphaenoides rupestris]